MRARTHTHTNARTNAHTRAQVSDASYLPDTSGQPMIVLGAPDGGKADNLAGRLRHAAAGRPDMELTRSYLSLSLPPSVSPSLSASSLSPLIATPPPAGRTWG